MASGNFRDVARFAWAHARGDRHRTVAAMFAVVVAVTSLAVLTATVRTERLQVSGTIANNFRSTYDILVRPKDVVSAVETSMGAVRPNYLTGTYGGITLDQVKQIAAVPDVQIAAPVAVVGIVNRNVMLRINVSQLLGNRTHAMVRYALTGKARNGTGITSTDHGYLYLTKNSLATVNNPNSHVEHSAMLENVGGKTVTACLASDASEKAATPGQAFSEFCWDANRAKLGSPATIEALLSIPMLVEAIDPTAEQALTDLESAIVDGRFLSDKDATRTAATVGGNMDTVPAVLASQLPFDFTATLTADELSAATITHVMATEDAQQRRELVEKAVPIATVGTITKDAAQAYSSDIAANTSHTARADESLIVMSVIRPGQVTYAPGSSGAPLSPQVVACNPQAWLNDPNGTDYMPTPPSLCDTSFRTVTVARARTDMAALISFDVVGKYDPTRIGHPASLNDVPLETYRSPVVTGADDASRAVLGGKPLLSDLNPGGYVQSPPALLVSLNSLPMLNSHLPGMNQTAPVSSVRVRVAGVSGTTPADRERIRVVAEQIRQRTGLDVDITAGASLANKEVALPSTASGTPALLVNEQWTKKGVAVAVSEAIDTKSVFLLMLVLASSALTVWLTATAAVQARRRELGVLACIGWSPRQRRAALLIELAAIGLAAGLIGVGLAVPIADVLGVKLLWQALVAAVPVGVILAVLPGLGASRAAGKVAPAELFRPPSSRVGTMQTVNGPVGVGVGMLLQRPSRLVVGVVGVGLAVASNALLVGVVAHVHSILIGSFLGDAVAVQVRAPDIAAAVLIGLLGLTALGTLLFLGVSEDARSLAALKAVGWTDAMLRRTISIQALLIGVIGGVLGAGVALGAWAVTMGTPDLVMMVGTLGIVLGAIVASLAVAMVPAAWARRLPTARILSSD